MPFAIVSIRSIRLRNVIVKAGGEPIETSLDAALAGDRLDITTLTARLRDADLRIEGQMSSLERREGHFDVRAEALPVDALLAALEGMPGGAPEDRRQSSAAGESPFRITAAISAPVATLGTGRVSSFATRLEATRAGLVLEPLTFDIDGGRFEARLALDPVARARTLDVRGNVSGLDVTRLQDLRGARKAAITGRLGARFTLQAPAQAGVMALLGAARGPVEISIRDGHLPGIEVIREAVIRTANRDRPPPPVKASDAFSQIDATLLLQGGPARISGLTMKAADFDLTGSGTISIPSGQIALDVDLTLTEALSEQAGRDLYRYAREGRRIVLPATIGGTLAEPTASIDVAEAAGRALRNRVEDEAKSILDRLIRRKKPD
jgi:uncharacterized protein involved in outer membrane biogenesis